MKQLINKSNYNIRQLKALITGYTAKEFDALSEPCYYPRTKLAYHEILRSMKLTDKDAKEFVKRQYKGTKAEKWILWQDPATNLLIVIMHLFILHRDLAAFKTTVAYYMFFQYGRLMHKQLLYCDENIFRYTIDTLTKTHLFVREKTIANSLYYLAAEVRKRYELDIQRWNVNGIIDFIGASRHRISQSVKSFVQNYYKVKEAGSSIKTIKDTPDEEGNVYQQTSMDRGKSKIDEAIKKLTIYKVVDKRALNEAKKLSKIKASIAELIANEMVNVEYADSVRMILNLYLKELKNANDLCGSGYERYLRSLMAVKRSNAMVYFKQQVNLLLMKVLSNLKIEKQYLSYTSQTQFIINLFLASYITMIFRSTMC
jgi:hypothetical protein